MNTTIVKISGDHTQGLYHLGIKEKVAFKELETRVLSLLSANFLLRKGQDFLIRAKTLLKKRESGLFDECIRAYSEGLGIDQARYLSFLELFEIAAHYGQVYPELKGLLPGCTSVFNKIDNQYTHSRLFDFPLTGIFEVSPRLYQWELDGRPKVLTYSCAGLAPLFFQGIHQSGFSFALHHKPSGSFDRDRQGIFDIALTTIFESQNSQDFKKELKKKNSITKWSFHLLDKDGMAQVFDIDGPTLTNEIFNLNESAPLIFTNIPIQKAAAGFENYINFSSDRQSWISSKLKSKNNTHPLDLLTDVGDEKRKNWLHPGATLSTVGAWHANLSTGKLDIKDGQWALVRSDSILRFDLGALGPGQTLKEQEMCTDFEAAWKKASKAQCLYDQGHFDEAYHELQMSRALMPSETWKNIFGLYLGVWDFKFVSNSKELAMAYKSFQKLKVPEILKDQWVLFMMRFEKRLGLILTVTSNDVSAPFRDVFDEEVRASKTIFLAWMKLNYPRMEILDVFSPHKN